MKIRAIFSLIIASLCLFLTNKLWLEFIPFPVSFDISGNGNYILTAVFNKKNNTDFVKVKAQHFEIDLTNKKHKVIIPVERVKHPKRFKLAFINNSKNKNDITLYNIKLKDYELSSDDLKSFEAINADLKVINDKIILTPTRKNFEIIYSKPLKLSANIRFDIFYFISIFVIIFLIVYKFTSYFTGSHSITNKNGVDFIFLTIFFGLLFIPISNIDNSEKSKLEKRYLAKFKPLITENQINNNFGKEFNEWFNDRFAFRKELILINNTFLCSVNNTCKTNVGKLYKKYNFIMTSDTLNAPKQEINIYIKNLNKFNEYCSKNNIKLYLLIVPRRLEFFDNYKLNDESHNKIDVTDDIIEAIKKNSNVNIVFPKEAMLKANKQTPVYYKTDTHWTKKGAYIGYYELMKLIQKDYPNVKILEENTLSPYYDKKVQYWWNAKFTEGSLLMKLNLPKFINDKILDTNYLYYKNPKSKYLEAFTFKDSGKMSSFDEEFYYPEGSDLRVMLIANSFGRNLVEFLPYSFKHTIRLYDNYRNLDFATYQPLIEEYKPDIIILNFHTSYIKNLGNIYKENNLTSKEEE